RASFAALAMLLAASLAGAAGFDLNAVAARAQQLAGEPFHDPKGQVPDWLVKLSYDEWRDIRFRANRALWRDKHSPFQLQFFHPGLYYNRVVAVNVVGGDGIHPVPFSPSLFDYGKNT